MRLSIIIPAFNEAKYIRATLDALRGALEVNRERLEFAEVIVCDNNSTDATASIAQELGAQVVFEPHNQISRARNAGAKTALGDWFLFVDADTIVLPETISELIDCIGTRRFVGGGGEIRMATQHIPTRLLVMFVVKTFRLFRWAGGAFVFCRADAFREIGGFDEEIYAGEEIFFCRKLKRWGRTEKLKFAFLVRAPVVTSARKMKTHGLFAFFKIVVRGIFRPRSTIRSRDHLDFFYDGKR